ncbi:hypothetical protein AB9K34_05750, partial [Sedimentitalea sp. XS_ASV28]|uniref:hypothetical protein n=1 Tax=Sedimentitalea sp. XS_ASV28 TaxID=3241296 RepID=UPI00351200EA
MNYLSPNLASNIPPKAQLQKALVLIGSEIEKQALDLPPFGPSFITRVCGFDLDNHGFRFGQARRARSPQIAQALGALAVA